jgi:hypothetical protein
MRPAVAITLVELAKGMDLLRLSLAAEENEAEVEGSHRYDEGSNLE